MIELSKNLQRRTFLQGAALAGVAIGVAACSPTSQNAASTSSGGPPSGKYRDLNGLQVGAVLETLSLPAIKLWGDILTTEAAGFGMKVTVADGERNVQKQTSQMETLITQKAALIILQATDAAGLSPVVTKAEQAGIPVISINQTVASPHTGFVGMGHYQMGVQVADGINQQLNGQGNIVVLEGVQGTGANIDRMAGFTTELKKYPGLKIVADQSAAFDRKTGHDVFQTILKGQPKIDAVFGVNDEMAIGAAQAAVEAGRRAQIKFWGADGTGAMLVAMKQGLVDGDSVVDIVAIPKVVMDLGAWIISAGIKGNQFAGIIQIPPFNVTKANIDSVAIPPA